MKEDAPLWVSLRDYMERHWADHERAHDRGQEQLEARLHALNDLREGAVTRQEYQARHEAVELSLNALRERVTKMEGRGAGLNAGWGYVVGAVGMAASVIAIIVLLLHG